MQADTGFCSKVSRGEAPVEGIECGLQKAYLAPIFKK
jgi:hypothetical protein